MNDFSFMDMGTWVPAATSLFNENPILAILALLVVGATILIFTRSIIMFSIIVVVFFAVLVFLLGDTLFEMFLGTITIANNYMLYI
jgi:hypothetical protein